jgi:hypothetical protein
MQSLLMAGCWRGDTKTPGAANDPRLATGQPEQIVLLGVARVDVAVDDAGRNAEEIAGTGQFALARTRPPLDISLSCETRSSPQERGRTRRSRRTATTLAVSGRRDILSDTSQ